jgi:hypothetical protein
MYVPRPVVELVEAGKGRPVVDRILPLAEFAGALRYAAMATAGKAVIDLRGRHLCRRPLGVHCPRWAAGLA